MTGADDLVRQVRTDPAAPIGAAICAPGGYGKTTVLGELSRVYAQAGEPVTTGWQPAGEGVLLVDDAHRLGDDRLHELIARAERPDARVIVAYRPWPRPAPLARLAEVLRRGRPTITLPALTPAQIQEQVESAAVAGFVAALSGGVPRYVSRLVPTLTGPELPGRVPAAALAPFAPELDELGHDLRTLLLAVEAGAGVSFDLIAALLERDPATIAELVAAGQAAGLLGADGALVPLARHAVAALGPIAQRVGVRQRLAELQLARGGPVLSLMRPLLGDGAAGPAAAGLGPAFDGAVGPTSAGLGPAFEAAGEEALGDDPALAARLFAAAADAGRPAVARRALATALTGDLDLAARLADRTVATGAPAQRAEAAYVAAVAMSHRGQLDRAAELLRWAGPGPGAGFRAAALVGAGRAAEADEVLAAPAGDAGDGPPTLLAATAALMARGVRESLTGEPATALSTLVQASHVLEPAGGGVLLPDSPAALAALIGLHSADLDVADATLDRAVRTGMGGPLLAARHLLLQAWSRMLRGQLAAAAATASRAEAPGGRDRLFAAALRVGLARRDSDLVGLRAIWPDACQVLIGQPVDLFTLLPLGELAVAAARLGEHRRVAAHLAEADRLLDRLGEPALWSAPLHWSRLHAAILAEQPAEAERHAAALDRLPEHGPYPAVLAAAAQSWLAVITDRIDPDQVETAARDLAALGLAWDGARLAGQAAIRTTDRKAMALLLDCARLLQGRPSAAESREPAADPSQLLSERERQVAALVLAGLTYKQVADRLYLSAKTVEHHIARIRQRLGCTDRRELLARLRELMPEGSGADGAVA